MENIERFTAALPEFTNITSTGPNAAGHRWGFLTRSAERCRSDDEWGTFRAVQALYVTPGTQTRTAPGQRDRNPSHEFHGRELWITEILSVFVPREDVISYYLRNAPLPTIRVAVMVTAATHCKFKHETRHI